ncbi:MAG TPA: PilN domain-containing protein [Stellaceae bacterium]|nr:PilN domain-containing protein [Stellaceae bacterium]
MAELLPTWLRRSAPARVDALVISPVGSLGQVRGLTAVLRKNGKEVLLGEFSPGAGGLRDLPPDRPIVLRLAQGNVLQKVLLLPLAAQSHLDQVLAFEMDRETPFAPEEVYWSHLIEAVDRRRDQLRVRLLLIPRVNLDPLLSALARDGIAPRWAEIDDDGGHHRMLLALDGDGVRQHDRSRRLLLPAAVCCGLLALAAVVTPFLRQSIQLATLDREVRAARLTANRAEALRHEIDRLKHSTDIVRGEVAKAGRPLDVLAEVTRVLPDDTYLTDLALRQRKLTLSGRSAGAARLISALAADSSFRNPAFAAPVTRLEAAHAEVFTIVADVGPQL